MTGLPIEQTRVPPEELSGVFDAKSFRKTQSGRNSVVRIDIAEHQWDRNYSDILSRWKAKNLIIYSAVYFHAFIQTY